MKPKGFVDACFDDFPHVAAEFATHDRHLVGEPDVDAAEGVLEEISPPVSAAAGLDTITTRSTACA
jgi:hypothetical protein